jgi:hypothetical protein
VRDIYGGPIDDDAPIGANIGSITLRVIVLTLPALTGAAFFVAQYHPSRPHCPHRVECARICSWER